MPHTFAAAGGFLTDSAIASGLAFLRGELEKTDERVREPLTSVTWSRDIVAVTGGGFVEYTSNLFADYKASGANQYGLVGTTTNTWGTVSTKLSKDLFKVFQWGNKLEINYFDMQKMQQLGRSLESILEKGLRMNYNKTLDQNVYQGFPEEGTTGLVNDTNVISGLAPDGAMNRTQWLYKTPDEILDDLNTVLVQTYENSEYDQTGIANHILVPPTQYSYLVSRKVSSAGNMSILNYLKENNWAREKGVDLQIVDSRWCKEAGLPTDSTGGAASDRLVAYRNEEEKVHFDITVPLSRLNTDWDANEVAYISPYASLFGQVKLLYPTTAYYLDGI